MSDTKPVEVGTYPTEIPVRHMYESNPMERLIVRLTRFLPFLIVSYILVGTGITLYNKWMLSAHHFTFPITMIIVCTYDLHTAHIH